MARGLAILATDVGAVASVVDDKNGWFVTPADSAALTGKLLGILHGEKSEIESRRHASILRIKEFTWEKIAALTANRIAAHLK
jgi:glycosyltransferase involved in cell wall biosynthesis